MRSRPTLYIDKDRTGAEQERNMREMHLVPELSLHNSVGEIQRSAARVCGALFSGYWFVIVNCNLRPSGLSNGRLVAYRTTPTPHHQGRFYSLCRWLLPPTHVITPTSSQVYDIGEKGCPDIRGEPGAPIARLKTTTGEKGRVDVCMRPRARSCRAAAD